MDPDGSLQTSCSCVFLSCGDQGCRGWKTLGTAQGALRDSITPAMMMMMTWWTSLELLWTSPPRMMSLLSAQVRADVDPGPLGIELQQTHWVQSK